METRHMHKSLMLQQARHSRQANRRDKENKQSACHPDAISEKAHQKFRHVLQKQNLSHHVHQSKMTRPNCKENHSFMNISDKENQMGLTNKRVTKFAKNSRTSDLLRQNVNRLPDANLNIFISKHYQAFPQEPASNGTMVYPMPGSNDLQGEIKRNVFNDLTQKNNRKNCILLESTKQDDAYGESSMIMEESVEDYNAYKMKQSNSSLSIRDNLTIEEVQEGQQRTLYTEDYSDKEETQVREPCDPIEFFLENIETYYDQLIRERGEHGSIACGGDIFEVQKCLKKNMRVILFDWLLDLCHKWKMKLRTFIITITFTDAVLMRCTVTKEIFQLVGLACLFIAGKFEEIYPPSLEEYLDSCNNAYSREQLLQIETIILNSIQFNLVILNHLDILELNLKQKLTLNGRAIKIYRPEFSENESSVLHKVYDLAEMFLMICVYDHRVHCLDMNHVVDFCIINAIRFVDLEGNEFTYKGVSSQLLQGFRASGQDLQAFLDDIEGLDLQNYLAIEAMMKDMMKTVFDSRQYSIIIKYRQFFVKILKTYFNMA